MFNYIVSDIKRFASNNKHKISTRVFIRCIFSQGFQAIIVYRLFNWLFQAGIPAQPFRFIIERFIEIVTGISIPASCTIGKGLRIHHFGGIIFHPSVIMGDNVTVYHGVTIGDKGGYGKAAKIGNNVLLGAGCKIIGEIEIGDHCIIGANAVITKSVEPNCIVKIGPPNIKKLRSEAYTK